MLACFCGGVVEVAIFVVGMAASWFLRETKSKKAVDKN